MRAYFKHILLGSTLLLSTSAVFASTTAPTAGLKIAVVDARMVLQKSPQMAVVNAQLDKQFKSRQQKVVDAQKKLRADVEKLNKNGAVMKEDERNALQEKINSESKNVQELVNSFQQDLTNAQNQSMQSLVSQLTSVVTKIAQEEGFDFVLQKDAVPYFNPKYDISNEALQAMNKA